MSYRIQYDTGTRKYDQKRKAKLGKYTAVFFLLFLILVNLFWPAGKLALHQILFPGDKGAVTEALNILAEDLHSGAGVVQAVEAFCREIIIGASDLH